MSRNRKPHRILSPRVEGLEDRTVPAGNVTAFTSGGALYLYGDDQGNQVYVGPGGGDSVVLASLDGTTTINGQAGPVPLGDVTERVEAHFGAGNDVLTMFQVHASRSLVIDTGGGDDVVTLVDVASTGTTAITTGAGNDFVRLFGGELSRDATIDLGADNDRVSVFNTMFRRNPVFVGGDGLDAAAGVNPQFRDTPTVEGFEAVYSSFIPLAVPDVASVDQGGAVQIPVLANDAAFGDALDPAGVVITRQPTAGSVTVNADGTVTYTNDGSGAASDSFGYVVRGTGGAYSNEATVTIAVTGSAPVSPPVSPPVTPPPPATGTGPVPVVSSSAPAVTNTSPIPFTVTFDVNVTGFVQADVTVTNGTVSGFTAVDARTYTVTVAPAGQGAVTLTVPANVAQDAAGNNNSASNTLTRTFDTAAPAVTANALTTNDSTPTLTGTVDDPAATVSVSVGGQTIAATVSGTSWTAAVPTALTDGSYPVTVTATDAAGNAGTATATLVVDTTAPTVAVTTTAGDPIGAGPTRFTATFSEGVTGFDLSDVVVTNGATASNFTAVDAQTYTFDVTPTIDGLVTVTVPAGAATDAAGNPNAAGSASRTASITVPGVTLATTAGDPTNAAAIPFTATFTGDVTGFAASDVVVVNGTVSNFTPVDGHTYTFDVTPAADGRVTVYVPANSAQDAAGGGNAASNPVTLTSDRTAPTPTVASAADDPTGTAPIPFTVTFDEDVTGFDAGGVTVANGAVVDFTATDARTYTFGVVPTGTVTVTVPVAAGAAADAAGNASAASDSLSRTFNGTVAVPDVTTTATDPTNLAAIPFTVTFTQDVTGFDQSDLAVTNGTVSNFAGSGTTYTFDVAPAADGTVAVTIPAGAATGPGGVPTAAGSTSVVSDRTAPTAAVASPAAPATNASPIPVTVTFSEAVTGFDANGLTVANGSVSNFAGSGATYTFDVTPLGQGDVDVTVSVNAGAAHDAAGNANPASAPLTVRYDTTAPTAAVTATTPTNADPVVFTVTFSEAVTDLTAAGLSATNGTLGTVARVDDHTFTVGVSPAQDGTVTLDVLAAAVQDLAGNDSLAASGGTVSDRTGPAVAVSPFGDTAVTGTASDNLSGVTDVSVSVFNGTAYWDGTGFNDANETFLKATTANGWADWSLGFTTPGTYTVRARATDAAGNETFVTQQVVIGPSA